ncbi:hypothetical protein PAV_16p00160 (plasmid) [Paenibacillus alvei DSM 29]|nr:hypothetical protein PAV_16p00160 [Paenibacillus alvei DSM 29]
MKFFLMILPYLGLAIVIYVVYKFINWLMDKKIK